MNKDVLNHKTPIFLHLQIIYSLVSSISILLLMWFRWKLVDQLTPFFEPMVEMFAFVLFGMGLLWVFIRLVYEWIKFKRITRKGSLPLAISGLTVLILLFFPFTRVHLQFNFAHGFKEREHVVHLIQEGKLKPDFRSMVHLPNKYQHLSAGGGDIAVYQHKRTQILFYTYRGVTDNMAGFVYSSDGKRPDEATFQEKFIEMIHFKPHWYWVSGT